VPSLRKELAVDAPAEDVYAIKNERIVHYNAAVQVFDLGERRCRVVWTIDLLPNEIEGYIDRRMDEAVLAMQATLGSPG